MTVSSELILSPTEPPAVGGFPNTEGIVGEKRGYFPPLYKGPRRCDRKFKFPLRVSFVNLKLSQKI